MPETHPACTQHALRVVCVVSSHRAMGESHPTAFLPLVSPGLCRGQAEDVQRSLYPFTTTPTWPSLRGGLSDTRDVASLPLSLGGRGLCPAVCGAVAAYWDGWTDQ